MKRLITAWVILFSIVALTPFPDVTVVAEETVDAGEAAIAATQTNSRGREDRRREQRRRDGGASPSEDNDGAVEMAAGPDLAVTPTSVKIGASITVSLTGFRARERVALSWGVGQNQPTLKTVRVSGSGTVVTTIRVPDDATTGTSKITASGDAGSVASASIRVQSGASPRTATATKTVTAKPRTVTPVASATRMRTATRTPTRSATTSPARTVSRTPTRAATVTTTRTATRTPIRTATAIVTRTATTNGGVVALWVDPQHGSDANTGATRSNPLRTLDEAWSRVPRDRQLTSSYRILLLAGTYPESSLPIYLESRYGSATATISIESVDGAGQAVLGGDLNIYDTRYLRLVGLVIVPGPPGDVIHCELCDHFTISDSTLSGGDRQAHETVKINQSTNVTIENSVISGAGDNAIDFVAVHGGRVVNNRISNAGDWCFYVKGGSAEIEIRGNEIFDCGTGGFTAGQGTGFQFMTPPHLTYEAEDITFKDNVVHDTEGAGVGVNGGKNIVIAENRFERVGHRSHLLEVGFGARSCDGQSGDEGRERCEAYLAQGGWGTTVIDDGSNYVRIPNKEVVIRDNVFANPAGYQTQWQHLKIAGAYSDSTQTGSNVPSPTRADDGLQITGNVFANGSALMPLGLGDDSGCQPSNPTCNETQLYRDNDINGR